MSQPSRSPAPDPAADLPRASVADARELLLHSYGTDLAGPDVGGGVDVVAAVTVAVGVARLLCDARADAREAGFDLAAEAALVVHPAHLDVHAVMANSERLVHACGRVQALEAALSLVMEPFADAALRQIMAPSADGGAG